MPFIGVGNFVTRVRAGGVSLVASIVNAFTSRVQADSGTLEATTCVQTTLEGWDSKNILASASWIFIPSGYKAGVAYDQVPSAGGGDLTWSRNSTANRTNSSGVIESVGANVPRLSYMYGSCPSALLEPQRTNSIRNSTMVGASTSPSTLPTYWNNANTQGLTRSIVNIGTENGLNYIDIRYNGTATNTSSIVISFDTTAASVGQNWTNSFYFKTISGIQPFFTATIFEFAAGYLTEGNVGFTPTSILTRYLITRTLTNASVTTARPAIQIYVTTGQSYDFTIRIAQPQMESGAYATTPIFTTGTSATRIADTLTRNNIYTNGLIGASGGTWYVELKNNIGYIRDSTNGFGITDTTNFSQNGLFFRQNASIAERWALQKLIGGVRTSVYVTTSDNVKLAIKWNGSTLDVFANGVKVVSASAFTTTIMEFLQTGSAVGIPTFIQAMALFNEPKSDQFCIDLTT